MEIREGDTGEVFEEDGEVGGIIGPRAFYNIKVYNTGGYHEGEEWCAYHPV